MTARRRVVPFAIRRDRWGVLWEVRAATPAIAIDLLLALLTRPR